MFSLPCAKLQRGQYCTWRRSLYHLLPSAVWSAEYAKRMRINIGPGIALLAGLTLFGCSEKPPVNDNKDRLEPSPRKAVRIVFDLPGDDIGGQEYQTILSALRDTIFSKKAGDVISSGFGMGSMEIVVAIDGDESIGSIRKIVSEVYPKAKYRIEQQRTR